MDAVLPKFIYTLYLYNYRIINGFLQSYFRKQILSKRQLIIPFINKYKFLKNVIYDLV